MASHNLLEDAERQLGEIEMLRSMFEDGEELVIDGLAENQLAQMQSAVDAEADAGISSISGIRLQLVLGEHDGAPVKLKVHLPLPGYPSTRPPELQVAGRSLPSGHSAGVRAAATSAAIETGGDGDAYANGEGGECVAAVAQAAKEYLEELATLMGGAAAGGGGERLAADGAADDGDDDDDGSTATAGMTYDTAISPVDGRGIAITHGESFTDRKSIFIAHVAPIRSASEARAVVTALCTKKKVARATHNMWAYRVRDVTKNGTFAANNDDDGETGAGRGMAFVLERLDAEGCMVVVTRWYGGVKLGPDRFKIINNMTRSIVTDTGIGLPAGASAGAEADGSKPSGSKKGKRGKKSKR